MATISIENLRIMELRISFEKETRKFDHFRVYTRSVLKFRVDMILENL